MLFAFFIHPTHWMRFLSSSSRDSALIPRSIPLYYYRSINPLSQPREACVHLWLPSPKDFCSTLLNLASSNTTHSPKKPPVLSSQILISLLSPPLGFASGLFAEVIRWAKISRLPASWECTSSSL